MLLDKGLVLGEAELNIQSIPSEVEIVTEKNGNKDHHTRGNRGENKVISENVLIRTQDNGYYIGV